MVTRYTLDGTNPTQSGTGGITYAGPFTVSSSAIVKYASWDTSSYAESAKTQPIAIAGSPPNLVQNPSFETPASATAVPDCWQQGASGTNTATWSHTPDARTGSFAESVTISALTNGDRKIVQRLDGGACAPAVVAGHSYQLSEWYKGTGNIAFTIFTRNAAGIWIYCQQTPFVPSAADWTQATFDWTQPTNSSNGRGTNTGYVPTGISFGLALSSLGSLTVDDASLTDSSDIVQGPPPDTPPPVTSIACDGGACSGSFAGSVSVSLAATDVGGSGVAVTRYTLDGTSPTQSGTGGITYSAPFTVAATATVTFASWDGAGNAEAPKTQVVAILVGPPNPVTARAARACRSVTRTMTMTMTIR